MQFAPLVKESDLDKPVYLTIKGKRELEKELAYLQNSKGLEIIEQLQNAKIGRAWMDSTEHQLIEEELAFVNGRIFTKTHHRCRSIKKDLKLG